MLARACLDFISCRDIFKMAVGDAEPEFIGAVGEFLIAPILAIPEVDVLPGSFPDVGLSAADRLSVLFKYEGTLDDGSGGDSDIIGVCASPCRRLRYCALVWDGVEDRDFILHAVVVRRKFCGGDTDFRFRQIVVVFPAVRFCPNGGHYEQRQTYEELNDAGKDGVIILHAFVNVVFWH